MNQETKHDEGRNTMRRRLIIASLIVITVVSVGLLIFVQPPAPAGRFPQGLSDSEKRQIVSAANNDALRQIVEAVGHAQFGEARRWFLNSRKQTVRDLGRQGNGTIWVTFGIDDPGASDGYAIWARYIMKRENGRWVIDKPI